LQREGWKINRKRGLGLYRPRKVETENTVNPKDDSCFRAECLNMSWFMSPENMRNK